MLRLIEIEGSGHAVYECRGVGPAVNWGSAVMVREQGQLVAIRRPNGEWRDSFGKLVDGRRYGHLRAVGIAPP